MTYKGGTIKKYLGLTLLPQAGVAIGMATMALAQLPLEYGQQIHILKFHIKIEFLLKVLFPRAVIRIL